MDAVAALNTEFVKSKLNAIETLGLDDEVEDITVPIGDSDVAKPIGRARSSPQASPIRPMAAGDSAPPENPWPGAFLICFCPPS